MKNSRVKFSTKHALIAFAIVFIAWSIAIGLAYRVDHVFPAPLAILLAVALLPVAVSGGFSRD